MSVAEEEKRRERSCLCSPSPQHKHDARGKEVAAQGPRAPLSRQGMKLLRQQTGTQTTPLTPSS